MGGFYHLYACAEKLQEALWLCYVHKPPVLLAVVKLANWYSTGKESSGRATSQVKHVLRIEDGVGVS